MPEQAPVADVGCGPRRVTALRRRLDDGARPARRLARRARRLVLGHPHAAGAAAGVVAEFARVLRTGGHLLLAFQAGDELLHLEQAYGHVVSLAAYRLDPGRVVELLETAGLDVHARLLREPEPPVKSRQACLLARSA